MKHLLLILLATLCTHALGGVCKDTFRDIGYFFSDGELKKLSEDWEYAHLSEGPSPLFGQTAALEIRLPFPKLPLEILGKVERADVVPGYEVLKVFDFNGETHWIDPKYLREARILRSKREPTSEEIEKFRSLQRVGLEVKPLKKFLCAQDLEQRKNPKYRDIEAIAKRNIKSTKAWSLFLKARCGLSFLNFGQGGVRLHNQYRWQKREDDERDFISEHGSNFVQGIGYMGLLHGCLSILGGDDKRRFLTLVVGANILGNVWEEIEIPGIDQRSLPMFASRGNEVKTDLKDFTSGSLGAAAYIVGTVAIEQLFNFSLRRMCL